MLSYKFARVSSYLALDNLDEITGEFDRSKRSNKCRNDIVHGGDLDEARLPITKALEWLGELVRLYIASQDQPTIANIFVLGHVRRTDGIADRATEVEAARIKVRKAGKGVTWPFNSIPDFSPSVPVDGRMVARRAAIGLTRAGSFKAGHGEGRKPAAAVDGQ